MSETFVRPNGKAYKPRRPPSVAFWLDHHEHEAVAVMRTHDFQRAIELASRWIDDLGLDPTAAYTTWWRYVPFDPTRTFDASYIYDNVRGVPCVVIPYD
jgi:hypothetical protein